LWQRLQKTAKVSPIEDMQRLLAAALFGLKMELVTIPPEDLPQRGGNKTFFQIDTKHPMWARIREQQNIAVYCDLNPNDTSMKLFFVPD
jgi:predicted component of type VI protein secretion system